jgi:hypothetical protein
MLDDPRIRTALKRQLITADPSIAVFDEFPIWRGDGRADVVAANGSLWGFEIKGEGDGLSRLPSQSRLYDSVFDFSVVVTAKKHLGKLREILPNHWGIEVAEETGGEVGFRKIRAAKKNSRTDKSALVRLFWKSEAMRVLRSHGLTMKPSSLIIDVWQKLSALSHATIATEVLNTLKSRGGCESALRQIQCDDSCTIEPIALRFLGR